MIFHLLRSILYLCFSGIAPRHRLRHPIQNSHFNFFVSGSCTSPHNSVAIAFLAMLISGVVDISPKLANDFHLFAFDADISAGAKVFNNCRGACVKSRHGLRLCCCWTVQTKLHSLQASLESRQVTPGVINSEIFQKVHVVRVGQQKHIGHRPGGHIASTDHC